MIKYKIYFILLSIIFPIYSCTDTGKELNIFDDFTNTVILNSIHLNVDQMKLEDPAFLLCMDSFLIVGDSKSSYFIHLIDTKNNRYLGKSGRRGAGNGEMIQPFNGMQSIENDNFIVLDINKKAIFSFHLYSILKNGNNYIPEILVNYSKNEMFLTSIIKTDNMFISTGLFNNGRYATLNSNGELNKIIIDENFNSIDPEVDNYTKSLVYQGKLLYNSKLKRIAISTRSGGIFEIFEISNSNITKYFEKHYLKAIYRKEDGAKLIRQHKDAFIASASNNKYIYLLFAGKGLIDPNNYLLTGSDIFIFDWEGTPIAHLKSDIEMTEIGVDDDNTLYGISLDNDKIPILVKFNVNI